MYVRRHPDQNVMYCGYTHAEVQKNQMIRYGLWLIGKTSLSRMRRWLIVNNFKQKFDRKDAVDIHSASMQALIYTRPFSGNTKDYRFLVDFGSYFIKDLDKMTQLGHTDEMEIIDQYFKDTIEIDELLKRDDLGASDRETLMSELHTLAREARSKVTRRSLDRDTLQKEKNDFVEQNDLLTPILESEHRQDIKNRIQVILNKPR